MLFSNTFSLLLSNPWWKLSSRSAGNDILSAKKSQQSEMLIKSNSIHEGVIDTNNTLQIPDRFALLWNILLFLSRRFQTVISFLSVIKLNVFNGSVKCVG